MKKNLLIVSDQPEFRDIFGALLMDSYTMLGAGTTAEAVDIINTRHVDLLLVSSKIVNGSCFDLISHIRKLPGKNSELPAVIMSRSISSAAIMSSHKLDVTDIIKLPVEPVTFAERVGGTVVKTSKPYERPDPVTGLHRKQYGEEEISELLASGHKGAMLLIELDHYSFAGSGVTEKTLITVRDIIKGMLRGEEVISVLSAGGFMLFVPDMLERGAVEDYAATIVRGIKAVVNDETVYVSIGLAVTERHGNRYADLNTMCDLGLNRARTSGKNKAMFYRW
ncbi:hypothetical protein FACS189499_00260 [Clostridia bacterium]|nr:hypothetical protein FACS189499_00260 [Clostridia bacterium]